jgi:hypothetical protein
MSGGFEAPLLGPGVELDSAALELMDAGWDAVAAQQDATMSAISLLASEPASANAEGRQAGLAAPSAAPLDSLRQAAGSFFNWVSGSGGRGRQRIVSITSTMNDGQRKELFDEWRAIYPDSPAAASDHVSFFSNLQSGQYDGSASQIHSQLLDVSATSVDAPLYAQRAQDKNILIDQIVVEEGKEGLKRGAELELEATTEALRGLFPGLAQGRDLAEKAIKAADYAEKIYEDPVTGLTEVATDKLVDAAKERLGDRLDVELLEELGATLSEASELTLGAASGMAGRDGSAESLDDFGQVSVWEPGASVALASNNAGANADGPQISVAIAGPDGLAFGGAPGKYSVQTFDSEGRKLAVLEAEVEPGWETLAGRATVSVERESARVLLARTPTPRVTPIPTAVPVFDWVLSEVVVNKDKDPLRADHPGEYYVGQYVEWTVSDGELTQHAHSVFRGAYQFDWTFNYVFDRPPERLRPGEKFSLDVDATSENSVVGYDGGYPAAEFQFVPRTGPTLIVAWNKPSGSMSQEFTAPTFMGQRYEVGAILWNCAPCDVTYVYLPVVEATPTATPATSIAATRFDEFHSCDERFESALFRGLCEGAREAKDLLESVESRAGAPNPCSSPGTDEQRLACDINALVRAGDPAKCVSLPEEVRVICVGAIAEGKRDPSLLVPYGDEALAAYAGTGDLSVLDLIEDPRLHDTAVFLALQQMLAALFVDDDDARLPGTDYCGKMRGGWGFDSEGYDDGPGLRRTCEVLVGSARAMQLDSEDECARASARADEFEEYEEDLGSGLTECRAILADYRSVPVTRR